MFYKDSMGLRHGSKIISHITNLTKILDRIIALLDSFKTQIISLTK